MNACAKDRSSGYTDVARAYAEQVVAGEILACRWVQRACQRQLDDLARFNGKASPYLFNPKLAADREGGAEVYSLATTRDEARIVFGDGQTMARRSPGFLGAGFRWRSAHTTCMGWPQAPSFKPSRRKARPWTV